jgi:hypothetical protein
LTYSVGLLDARRSRRDYRINRWDAPLSVEVFNATYKEKAMKILMADIVAITGQFKNLCF